MHIESLEDTVISLSDDEHNTKSCRNAQKMAKKSKERDKKEETTLIKIMIVKPVMTPHQREDPHASETNLEVMPQDIMSMNNQTQTMKLVRQHR